MTLEPDFFFEGVFVMALRKYIILTTQICGICAVLCISTSRILHGISPKTLERMHVLLVDPGLLGLRVFFARKTTGAVYRWPYRTVDHIGLLTTSDRWPHRSGHCQVYVWHEKFAFHRALGVHGTATLKIEAWCDKQWQSLTIIDIISITVMNFNRPTTWCGLFGLVGAEGKLYNWLVKSF